MVIVSMIVVMTVPVNMLMAMFMIPCGGVGITLAAAADGTHISPTFDVDLVDARIGTPVILIGNIPVSRKSIDVRQGPHFFYL
jgi:hypothetical protein